MRIVLSCVLFSICCLLQSTVGILRNYGDTDALREKRSVPKHGETGHNVTEEEEKHHEDHSELIDSLFHKYDSSSSPTHATNEPTVVFVNLQLLSLDDINDEKMEYVIDTRMTFFWKDARLMTPECRDENEDCDDHFDMKNKFGDLWTPDLYILNSRSAKSHEHPLRNGMVYLEATGKILLSKRLTLTLRCPMNLVLYPLDTQRCPLLICPYSLTDNELILKWTEDGVGIGIIEEAHDGQNKFKLQKPIKYGYLKLKYNGPDVSGFFSCVNATFTLKRLNGYHMGYSYTVTSFIVIVSWIAFWLPISAVPARVTLGVTTLLTLLTTANFVRTSLPPIAYVTAIDLWVGMCTLLVFSVLLLFPLAIYFSSKNIKEPQKTTIAGRRRIEPITRQCKTCGGQKNTQDFVDSKGAPVDLDKICRTLFPIIFLIFNIVYWWYYMTQV